MRNGNIDDIIITNKVFLSRNTLFVLNRNSIHELQYSLSESSFVIISSSFRVMYKHGKEHNRSYALAFRIKFETYLCMNCMLESVTRQSRVIGYVGNVIRIEGNGNFLHVVCRIITALVSQV